MKSYEVIHPEHSLDMAIGFALIYCNFQPGESPHQTEEVERAINDFVLTQSYNPINKAPVAEIGVLAYCQITDIKPPDTLRWQCDDPKLRDKLNALCPRQSE
jgi:hypothetical protein